MPKERGLKMPNWLWNILEKLFSKLDYLLHDVTYRELDELCVCLSNEKDQLIEENECLEDALYMHKRGRF
jgi:hypothetical protein